MSLVILDRDGVINHDSDTHIKSPDEWRPISGSLEAIARLCRAEYKIVIATNQSGIARRLFGIDTLNRIHSRMLDHVRKKGGAIDAIFFCPHDAGDGCVCRKPKPGMLLDIAKRLKTTLHGVPFVGDSVSDLHAAIDAGAQPVLLLSGKNELDLIPGQRITANTALSDVPVFQNLAAFTDAFLEGRLNTSTVAPKRRS